MTTDRPLTVVTDEPLLDQILQFAAVAGCELDRASDITAARRRWGDAPLVLLDHGAVRMCLAAKLPRRTGIVVVATTQPRPEFWQRAVALGVEQVLTLPAEEAALLAAFEDAAERPARVAGRVVAVLGGRGGAGASILAAATALTALHRGGDVLLVDGDPFGGGLDLVLGVESDTGLRWPALRVHSGRIPAAALRCALPGRNVGDARLSVVSCDRDGPGPEPGAMAAVIEAGRRAGSTVVCDLPRHPSDAAAAALDRVDMAVLVVPADLRACAAARRVAAAVRHHGVRLHTVVRGPAPGGLPAAEVARVVGAPLLTAVRAEPWLDRTLERGTLHPRPRGPLATAATAILDALPTKPNDTTGARP
ncbi:MAG TPA: septum site-determining protein Ssd [Pseudonocardiaceae bacterium]|jgi:secretion/DNA translocation related CpaE-like protein|nr:septum site-determining protein Ssd [Pseudonocardiaceae bacterium]